MCKLCSNCGSLNTDKVSENVELLKSWIRRMAKDPKYSKNTRGCCIVIEMPQTTCIKRRKQTTQKKLAN
jgi:hypothetical protein